MRALLLTLGSFVFTASVIGNAYIQKKQFYPSVVYITKSNPSMAVLYIQAFVFVILTGKLMRKVFFGQLRPAEMEHLIERSWYAVTETCLAFTVFRDDFSPRFVALFTLLLFLKCFHWLAEDRVDYMERSPVISWVFHFRVITLLTVLAGVDIFFINHAYYSTLIKGASVQLVFGFEYAILLTAVLTILVKYILHTIDMQNENPWESKAVYLLYTELVLGCIKVILYVTFLVIMIKVHTFPLFAIRPTYLTMRAFKKALNDVIMSRRAIRNMNTLYPDATEEELRTGDNVCIICREEMLTGCKKLPCNHIFHSACLRSWFQRQQTCPTCRMDVLRSPRQQTTHQHQQQQQQPQQQQPQPPNFGAMFPGGMFPAGFPMWPPAGQQPPQPAASGQQTPASPTSTTSTSGAATAGSTSSGATPSSPAAFPMSMPPFMPPPFMSMPFSSFAPTPPADLAGLSDEELRAMEGSERENVEARVQCLRNIQTLLDAAMLHIQQYTQVAAQLRHNSNSAFSQGSTSATATNSTTSHPKSSSTASSSTSSSSTSSNSTSSSSLKSSSSSKFPTEPTYSLPRPLSSYEESGARPKIPKGTPAQSSEAENIPEWDDQSEDSNLNEMRKRRLQKFSSTGSSDQKDNKVTDNLDLD